jgi:hypothetical protein
VASPPARDTRHIRVTESTATRDRTARDAVRQTTILIGAAAVYFGVRVFVEGDRPTAVRNAERLLDAERAVGLDLERGAQDLVVERSVLRAIGNFSYVWFHWPLLIVFLGVLFVRNRERFVRLRNALIVSGAVGLVFFTVLPTAPPRFLPGYTGTVSDAARRHYLDYPLGWTNQVAAFPSFHVGWTLIACLAMASTIDDRRGRALVMLPAVFVGLAVVTTGNHYVFDTLAGIAIAVAAYLHQLARAQRDEAPPELADEA